MHCLETSIQCPVARAKSSNEKLSLSLLRYRYLRVFHVCIWKIMCSNVSCHFATSSTHITIKKYMRFRKQQTLTHDIVQYLSERDSLSVRTLIGLSDFMYSLCSDIAFCRPTEANTAHSFGSYVSMSRATAPCRELLTDAEDQMFKNDEWLGSISQTHKHTTLELFYTGIIRIIWKGQSGIKEGQIYLMWYARISTILVYTFQLMLHRALY